MTWTIGNLKPGMTAAQAVELRGEPSHQELSRLEWDDVTAWLIDDVIVRVTGPFFEHCGMAFGGVLGTPAASRPGLRVYHRDGLWLSASFTPDGTTSGFTLEGASPTSIVRSKVRWTMSGVCPRMSVQEVVARLGKPAYQGLNGLRYHELTADLADGWVSGVTGQHLCDSEGTRLFSLGEPRVRSLALLGEPDHVGEGLDIYEDEQQWLSVLHVADRVEALVLTFSDPRQEGSARLRVLALSRVPIVEDPILPPPSAKAWRVDGITPGLHRDRVVWAHGVPTSVHMPATKANFMRYSPWWATFGSLTVRFADLLVSAVEGGTRLTRQAELLAKIGEDRATITARLGEPAEEDEENQLYHDGELDLHLAYVEGRLEWIALHGRPLGPPFEELSPAASEPWLEGWAIGGVCPDMNREDVTRLLGEPTLARTPHESLFQNSDRVAFGNVSVQLSPHGQVLAVRGSELTLVNASEPQLQAGDHRRDVLARLGAPDWPKRPHSALAIYRRGPQELQITYDRDLVREFSLEQRKPGRLPPDPPDHTDEGPGSAVPKKPHPPKRTGSNSSSTPR